MLDIGASGIDVSKWQGSINWKAVRNGGVEFAYVKATEGAGYRDEQFRMNMANAHSAAPEILLGCYHFGRVSRTATVGIDIDAKNEAEKFCEEIDMYRSCWTLPPMLDLEWDERTTAIPSVEIVEWAKMFLATVADYLKVGPCGIYTQASFWKYKLGSTGELHGAPLWLAGKTQIPGWSPMINQYSAKGRIAGISGNVDLDRWMSGGSVLPLAPSMMTALLSNMFAKAAGKPKRSDTP